MIIDDQLTNRFCPVMTMSMAGQVMGLDSNGQAVPLAQEEVVSGKYLVLFCQPEGTATDQGQRILRSLAGGDQIRGLFVDEVHQVFIFPRSFDFVSSVSASIIGILLCGLGGQKLCSGKN